MQNSERPPQLFLHMSGQLARRWAGAGTGAAAARAGLFPPDSLRVIYLVPYWGDG